MMKNSHSIDFKSTTKSIGFHRKNKSFAGHLIMNKTMSKNEEKSCETSMKNNCFVTKYGDTKFIEFSNSRGGFMPLSSIPCKPFKESQYIHLKF